MAMNAPTASLGDFVSDVFGRAGHGRAWSLVGWSVALGGHALAVALAPVARAPSPPAPPPLVVELAPPAPTPPAPPPPPAAPPEVAPPQRAAAVGERAPQPAAPPEPARAGALVTAKADPAPGADEPVDFTNDPSMLGFGSGVVAIGGKAQVGAARAPLPAPGVASAASSPRPGDGLTPASDLSRKPSLGESDPCHGYFPAGARDDTATATVLVTLAKSGAVSAVQLLSESPPAQGFGGAARACMASKRFTPGLDRDGRPAATALRVSIRFRR
jgi:protein TonB